MTTKERRMKEWLPEKKGGERREGRFADSVGLKLMFWESMCPL